MKLGAVCFFFPDTFPVDERIPFFDKQPVCLRCQQTLV
jgi:hypothetical protein